VPGIYRALVLFDIDGTLLSKAGPHHRTALEGAVTARTGRASTTDGIPVAGMLDTDIVMAMLAATGVARARSGGMLAGIRRDAARRYRGLCPALHEKVCPGVKDLLRALRRAGTLTGLVTGNFEGIAWKKLERAGLSRFFRFGAFAGQGATRGALARRAVAEALRNRWIDNEAPVSLVGDHMNDILAAREAGVRSVAVGTGVVSLKELAGLAPDILIPDLRSMRAEVLMSHNGSPNIIR
jgi:phosphoglycolate phosphatase-like HAD superfamily hydrolase